MGVGFWKFHGAGNDFIAVDGRSVPLAEVVTKAAAWCDRRRGIGADGVLHVEPKAVPRLHYINPDGSDAFCGNGLRCAVVFARHVLGAVDSAAVDTVGGRCRVLDVETTAPNRWSVEVTVPRAEGPVTPISLAPEWTGDAFRVGVGVPHVILPTPDLTDAPVDDLGPRLRRHARLAPDGANIHWVSERAGRLLMRTYERGVEAETLSCGSGAVAVAMWWRKHGDGSSPRVRVTAASGDELEVGEIRSGEGADGAVVPTLRGPATLTFAGETT